MTLSRRRFLGIAGGATAAGVVGAVGAGSAWERLVRDRVEQAIEGRAAFGKPQGWRERVLVVVQLSGGNDGLNTVVPANDGRYHDARPTLGLAERKLQPLTGTDRWAVPAALAPLLPSWREGRLLAVHGVGFPEATRSHFEALDAWWTGGQGERGDGWLGRWLERDARDDHERADPLRAVALGGGSPALRSRVARSTFVHDPRSFRLRAPKGASAEQIVRAFTSAGQPVGGDGGSLMDQARASMLEVTRSVDVVARGAGTEPGKLPAGIAGLLQTAAGIIDLRVGTRVIVVNVGGFDTHAGQEGRHPQLLGDVAEALATFERTLAERGHADRVLTLTTSEFGRRVAENGSGTDHGKASVQFLAGPMVAGGRVVGEADLAKLDDGDLPAVIDARSLYAVGLDWLSADPGLTDDVLGRPYDRHALLRP